MNNNHLNFTAVYMMCVYIKTAWLFIVASNNSVKTPVIYG